MSKFLRSKFATVGCIMVVMFALVSSDVGAQSALAAAAGAEAEFHDAHLHLTNYAQEGTDIHEYLKIMGSVIGRSTIFGLPVQQMWSYANTGDFAPYYYLQTDAPLYYYSFTDAFIAMAYRSLSPEQQARIDPMITGFNPADMYAADHIRRVLLTFPGVFSGIGEFSIHKEFVSSKIAGEVATLTNPALDKIFDFCAEVGMPAILHNDINMPFPKPDQEPYMLKQLKALFERHPKTTIIWAHFGLGRIVRPLKEQAAIAEKICTDPKLSHVMIDISWDEVAKYATATPESIQRTADMLNKYPDRFLFGSDCVSPKADSQAAVYRAWDPIWKLLTPEAKAMICKGNYERIFDKARKDVRAWEQANLNAPRPEPKWSPISGLDGEPPAEGGH
jgi:predicted TIM-barrel fold metal-dependent hydrolase